MEQLGFDNDILELEGIESARENLWLQYKNFDGVAIPRVTHIIAYNRDQKYLINWAANIGRNKYDFYTDKALEVGTYVHSYIDLYLESKYIQKDLNLFQINYDEIGMVYRPQVFNAVENFKAWEANLNSMGYFIEEVVGLEIPVYCPWYGGTIDAILKINGAYYIIDFKTSKSITADYLIQASAYMWCVNNGYMPNLPHIDGIGIIRVDKNTRKFNDLFLNDFNPDNHIFLIRLQETFIAYVNSYYRTISTDYMFDQYKKVYNFDTIIPITFERKE